MWDPAKQKILNFWYDGPVARINEKFISRRFVLSPKYRDAKEGLALAAKIAMRDQFKGELLKNDIGGIITLYWKGREPDVDAYVKFALDAMSGIVYEDDKQVRSLTLHKVEDKSLGEIKRKIRFLVYELEGMEELTGGLGQKEE